MQTQFQKAKSHVHGQCALMPMANHMMPCLTSNRACWLMPVRVFAAGATQQERVCSTHSKPKSLSRSRSLLHKYMTRLMLRAIERWLVLVMMHSNHRITPKSLEYGFPRWNSCESRFGWEPPSHHQVGWGQVALPRRITERQPQLQACPCPCSCQQQGHSQPQALLHQTRCQRSYPQQPCAVRPSAAHPIWT